MKGLQSALMAAGFPLPCMARTAISARKPNRHSPIPAESGLSASGAADAETLAALRLLNG
ncbi:MAG: hypothetical protein ACLT1X_11270 [Christensenellales bacterium]